MLLVPWLGDEAQRDGSGQTPVGEERPGVALTEHDGLGHLSQLCGERGAAGEVKLD
jgi:hypothetical protein